MTYNPAWKAAQNGLPGNLEAVNHAAQIDQFLAAHGVTPVYQGNLIYGMTQQTSTLANAFFWLADNIPSIPNLDLLHYDFDQPFVMPASSTAIGRVQVALLPVGNAADVQVTLYPDNGSGSPNTSSPLASTVIPAGWVNNLAAPDGLTSGGPLATPRHNAILTPPSTATPWTQPAISANGAAAYATPVTSGNYVLLLGGYDAVANAACNNVATVRYLGGQTLSGPSPQPSLPQGAWYAAATATDSMVMFAGGTNSASFYSNVWTASWDANTGVIGSWSAQSPLPVPLNQSAAASWGDTVYIIGGSTSGSASNAQTAVWYASAVNGQISQWLAAPPLPQPLQVMFAGVVGDWLIVTGGQTSAGATSGATYYAPISLDGSLGGWQIGPSLPKPAYALGSGWDVAVTDTALIVYSGLVASNTPTNVVQTLTASADGLGGWQYQSFTGNEFQAAAFPNGSPGGWDLFALEGTNYVSSSLMPVPLISVPLPVTGLTAGGTYHLVVHQIGGDSNDFVQLGEIVCTSQQWLYANRYSGGPWTAHGQHGIMLNIYDQTSGGQILHTWEDPTGNQAARTTTLVNDYLGRLLGVCQATMLPQDPLNQNNLTTSSTSPWTATGGTLTASTAQTHGGYAYSGLLTPSGSAALSYAASELLPVTPGQWYEANGWLYSGPGYSNVSLSVNWYDSMGNYLSTSSNTVSLPAATWVQVDSTFQAPGAAAKGQLVPTEGGTPPVTATLYLSNVTLIPADPTTLASVAQVDYPTGALWPPIGVTQLN